ncbi:hypothetical protein J6590_090539 [Homalodisca vitripennis]|nr:hypothetical protein J6590_090539 [Homalodisca vitripennis]
MDQENRDKRNPNISTILCPVGPGDSWIPNEHTELECQRSEFLKRKLYPLTLIPVFLLMRYDLEKSAEKQQTCLLESRVMFASRDTKKGHNKEAQNEAFTSWCLLYRTIPITKRKQKPMCHFNLGNLMDVQERHITNRIYRDSGVHGQFDRSSLLWEMTVGVGGVHFLTSEVLANLTKGMPSHAYFDWKGWFRAGLPFFQRRPLLPNLTHPEYPVTPEAAQSLQHVAQHVPGTKLFQATVKQNMLRNLYHELLETGCNNVPGLAHAQYCLLAVNLTSTLTDTCSLFKS